MNTTLVVAGAVFVAAAIVGRGLEGAGIKIPALDKGWQHFCLAGLGFLVIAIGTVPQLLANDASGPHPAASQQQPTVAPDTSESSNIPSDAPVQGSQAPSQSPSDSRTAQPNGAVLGSYTVELPGFYSIPLDPSKPTQSQFDSNEQNGDLDDNCSSSGCYQPLNGDRMVELQNGATPTYDACTSNTGFTGGVVASQGTAFCVLENGKVAGVEVVSQSSTTSDYVLKVTVWRNAS